MNYRDLKRASIGDRVAFRPLEHDAGEYAEGTITGFSPSKHKATVEWEDGAVSKINEDTYDRIHLIEKPPLLTADLTQATAEAVNELRKEIALVKLEKKNELQGNSPTDRRQTPNAGRRP
jgi:hypothetical protein